jgi:outer membrane protein W
MIKMDKRKVLAKGPDLDRFIAGKERKFVSYVQGANMYSMNYYSFVNLAKEAGANIRVKKNVVVDVDVLDAYIANNFGEGEGDRNV